MKFLLDENLSRETAEHITFFGYQVATVFELGLSQKTDQEIVLYATHADYILMTFDLDFVLLYRVFAEETFSVVVFRLRDQTVESVNKAIDRLFASHCLEEEIHQKALVIVDEVSIRVRRESERL
ncbi:DUF5615 family PIN-like protein [Candidatus Uhrbacteria bacterium]|nr:DUF5615 family PIN-like protein [Candidatus Uhrbacteria bacterium]